MRSSLTRSHLKELEGKKVIYKSYYAGKKKPVEGSFRILLQNVRMGLWDSRKSVLDTEFTHFCDHCWIVLPEVDPYGNDLSRMRIERYAKGYGLGTVSYYTRSDDSIDLSITPISFIAMNRMPQLAQDLSNLGRVLKIYRSVYHSVKKGKVTLLSTVYNQEQSLKYIEDQIKYFEGITHSHTVRALNISNTHKVTSPRSFKDLVNVKSRSSARLAPAEQSRILRSVLSGRSN